MVSAGLGSVKADAPDGGGAPAAPGGFPREATRPELHLTAMGHLGRVPLFSSFTVRYEASLRPRGCGAAGRAPPSCAGSARGPWERPGGRSPLNVPSAGLAVRFPPSGCPLCNATYDGRM